MGVQGSAPTISVTYEVSQIWSESKYWNCGDSRLRLFKYILFEWLRKVRGMLWTKKIPVTPLNARHPAQIVQSYSPRGQYLPIMIQYQWNPSPRKRYLDWFSRFCRASTDVHVYQIHTHTHTTTALSIQAALLSCANKRGLVKCNSKTNRYRHSPRTHHRTSHMRPKLWKISNIKTVRFILKFKEGNIA